MIRIFYFIGFLLFTGCVSSLRPPPVQVWENYTEELRKDILGTIELKELSGELVFRTLSYSSCIAQGTTFLMSRYQCKGWDLYDGLKNCKEDPRFVENQKKLFMYCDKFLNKGEKDETE